MGWDKFDAKRKQNDKPRSADKLAASIRSALGQHDAAPKKDDHPGHVVSRSVTGRSVVSRSVVSRSVVSLPGKKELKAKPLEKGEKNFGDSTRTKIRMAEHGRKKNTESEIDKATPKTEIEENPHNYLEARKTAVLATKKTISDSTIENHEAAIAAHSRARDLAAAEGYTGVVNGHVLAVKSHQSDIAKINKGTTDVPKAAKRPSAPKPPAPKPGAETAARVRELRNTAERETRLAATGPDSAGHRRAAKSAKSEINRLWPKMSERDVADSIVSDSVSPEHRESLVNEVARHVAFTKKNDAWKHITVDVTGDMKNPNVRGKTIGHDHVLLNSNLFGPGAASRRAALVKDHASGHFSAGAFGPDDIGGHKSTLAHEVGHLIHYSSGTKAYPDQDKASKYGSTNMLERGAEAYAAAFARAHGHDYSHGHEADLGDHIVSESIARNGGK